MFLCVGNDDDVRDVVTGPTARSPAPAPARCWSTTPRRRPASPASWPRRAAEFGVGFVDAPVSGGQAGAENGAADDHVRQRRRGVLRARRAGDGRVRQGVLADGPGRVGPDDEDGQPDLHRRHRAGSRGGRQLRRASAGLDVDAGDRRRSARARRRAGRWRTAARTMARGEFDFGFAVEWMRKDLGICLDEADRNGARLPVTALDRPVLQAGRSPAAASRWDTSSLIAPRSTERRDACARTDASADGERQAVDAADGEAVAPASARRRARSREAADQACRSRPAPRAWRATRRGSSGCRRRSARWRLAFGRSRRSACGSSNTAGSWLAAPSTRQHDRARLGTSTVAVRPDRTCIGASARGRCAAPARRSGAARRPRSRRATGSSRHSAQLVGVAQQRERAVADQVDGRLVAGDVEQRRRTTISSGGAQPVAGLLGRRAAPTARRRRGCARRCSMISTR